MNFKKVITTILVAAAVAFAAGYFGLELVGQKNAVASNNLDQVIVESDAVSKLKDIQEKEEADDRFGQYVINMMYRTDAAKKLSDTRKNLLARAIVRVSNDVFETLDQKRAFVIALSIESSFQRLAQSPTGPKGLSQVARNSFHEGLKNCGLPIAADEDVWETEINLYAGACYFRALLRRDVDPALAIPAYNQGPNSPDAKMYAKNGHLESIEALKYVARFNFIARTVTDEKTPGVPAIQELPKVTPPTSDVGK